MCEAACPTQLLSNPHSSSVALTNPTTDMSQLLTDVEETGIIYTFHGYTCIFFIACISQFHNISFQDQSESEREKERERERARERERERYSSNTAATRT